MEIDKAKISTWIKEDFQGDTISFTTAFGEYLVKNSLTTSQIRNIFSEVKRIAGKVHQEEGSLVANKKAFLMLRPKLAYAAKRAGGRGIDALREVLETAHIAVTEVLESPEKTQEDGEDAFANFVDFFEAILAYHKASGGKD